MLHRKLCRWRTDLFLNVQADQFCFVLHVHAIYTFFSCLYASDYLQKKKKVKKKKSLFPVKKCLQVFVSPYLFFFFIYLGYSLCSKLWMGKHFVTIYLV